MPKTKLDSIMTADRLKFWIDMPNNEDFTGFLFSGRNIRGIKESAQTYLNVTFYWKGKKYFGKNSEIT